MAMRDAIEEWRQQVESTAKTKKRMDARHLAQRIGPSFGIQFGPPEGGVALNEDEVLEWVRARNGMDEFGLTDTVITNCVVNMGYELNRSARKTGSSLSWQAAGVLLWNLMHRLENVERAVSPLSKALSEDLVVADHAVEYFRRLACGSGPSNEMSGDILNESHEIVPRKRGPSA